MTYLIIRDTLIMIYLFYNLHKHDISKSKKYQSFLDEGSIFYDKSSGINLVL